MNTYVALCAVGAEKILGNEIKQLGYTLAGNAPGRVAFTGDDDALYRANFCLRTSDRVYIQMAKYHAEDFDELFENCSLVDWQDVFKKDSRIVVDKVRTYKSKLNSGEVVVAVAGDVVGLHVDAVSLLIPHQLAVYLGVGRVAVHALLPAHRP